MPVDHYENFPVASFCLPRRLRKPIQALYAFARSADDIADEGNAPAASRLAALDAYRSALDRIACNKPSSEPIFQRLAPVIAEFELPLSHFYDLLDAFEQDLTVHQYADFETLSAYCQKSANPVGRLMLRLLDADDPMNQIASDQICTALQLINFWQDIAIDYQKNRIYLPQKELQQFGITPMQIAQGHVNAAWCALMQFQCARARHLLTLGAALGDRLRGRFGIELRMMIAGGKRILDRIDAVQGDVFGQRPTLNTRDRIGMLIQACPWPNWAKPQGTFPTRPIG